MKRPIAGWRKLLKGGLLGGALVALALCVAPLRASGGVRTAAHKAGVAHKRPPKRYYRRIRYRRHYYYRRHRIYLPRVPSKSRTEQIQEALARGGYFTHDPNGRWDRSTEDALRRFQEANGLPPTGKLDAPSLQKLGLGSDVAGVAAPKPVISSSNQTIDTFSGKTSGPGR